MYILGSYIKTTLLAKRNMQEKNGRASRNGEDKLRPFVAREGIMVDPV